MGKPDHPTIIAICSDSHDNIPNIKTFLDYCKKNQVARIIHCGDVTEDATVDFFKNNFTGKIDFVPGNAEISEQTRVKRTNRFQKIKHRPIPFITISIDGLYFAACHTRDKAKRLAEKKLYDIVFYGHNHKPWQEKRGESYMINPGNLAGMFYPASFAVYDTTNRKLELKILGQLDRVV